MCLACGASGTLHHGLDRFAVTCMHGPASSFFLQGTHISNHADRGATIQTMVKHNCEYRPVDRGAVLSHRNLAGKSRGNSTVLIPYNYIGIQTPSKHAGTASEH